MLPHRLTVNVVDPLHYFHAIYPWHPEIKQNQIGAFAPDGREPRLTVRGRFDGALGEHRPDKVAEGRSDSGVVVDDDDARASKRHSPRG